MEALYRSRWGDQVVVSYGEKLYTFDVRPHNPVATLATLVPVKKNEFRIQMKNRFDAVGEIVRFVGKPGQRPNALYWGPNLMTRVGKPSGL